MPNTWNVQPVISRRHAGALHDLLYKHAYDPNRGKPVRCLVLGDSQETSVGGAGIHYAPSLQHAACMMYGNHPETTFLQLGTARKNPGAYPGAMAVQANGGTQLATTNLPPGVTDSGRDFTSSHTNNFVLQPDWFSVAPRLMLSGADWWDKANAQVDIDIFALTRPSASGQIAYYIIRQSLPEATSGGSQIASGTTTMDLVSDTLSMKSQTVGPFTFSSSAYLRFNCNGSSATACRFAGVRFRNRTDTTGISFTFFSAGGKKIEDLEIDHPDCGPFLRGLEFDFVLRPMGTNDAYSGAGYTAAEWKAMVLADIAFIRTILQRPDIPIIYPMDDYRLGGTAGQDAEYDQYPGVMDEIEQEVPNVWGINVRRATQRGNFGPTNLSLSGLTDRGAWAQPVAFSVNDRVHIPIGTSGFGYHFKCIVAHTSSATDCPLASNTTAAQNWQPIRVGAQSTTSLDVSDDAIHHNDFGGRNRATATFLGLMALAGASAPSAWKNRMPDL